MDKLASLEEEALVLDVLKDFAEHQQVRGTTGTMWNEIAELILPTHRNTFFFGDTNTPGEKKTERQIDATGALALKRFGSIMDSMLTPRNSIWHELEADDDYVMKDRDTRLWFEDATKVLFKMRNRPTANHTQNNRGVFVNLGAFGNGPLFIDKYLGYDGVGFRYRALPMGESYFSQNHQGVINKFIRWFRMTGTQAAAWWGYENLPEVLQQACAKLSQQPFDFLHRICERQVFDPSRYDAAGKPFASVYICMQAKRMMQPEGGYRTWPIPTARYEQAPGETYGRGPASMVLPSLKTLNTQKRTFLKQGHRSADPVLLSADQGMVDFSLRPGAMNPGGWSADGKPLVGILPTGNIQTNEKMMEMETIIIKAGFLVDLFQILTETPQMSATEVIERVREKGILIAPEIGAQETEYLGPKIHRELDLASDMGMLKPVPPRLREAIRGRAVGYQVKYTSPIAKAARAGKAAGFMRALETTKELVQVTQDSSLLDIYNFDEAGKEIADIQDVPESWMATENEIKGKRQQRAKVMAAQQEIQAAPAKAGMMKAQATQVKAGMIDPNQQQQPGAPQQ